MMKITHALLTAALAVGLTIGVASAQQSPPPNGQNNNNPNQPYGKKKKQDLPPGVRCQPGFYGLADCNVSRNGRTFGPEGYDYAIETGQHIGR